MGVDFTTQFIEDSTGRQARGVSGVSLAAQKSVARPRLTPAILPGSITIGAATTSPSISPLAFINALDPTFKFSGGLMLPIHSNQYTINAFNKDSNFQDSPGRFEMMIETQKFEFSTGGIGSNGAFRVLINDQYISLTATAAGQTSGGQFFWLIDMGSRQIFKLTVEMSGTAYGGITFDATAGYWPTNTRQPRVLFLGDSITAGTGATTPLTAWPQWAAQRLGWEDPWVDGEGGTGYLDPGSSGGSVFNDRLTYDLQYAFDTIVVFGGINDRANIDPSYTTPNLTAAVGKILDNIINNAPVGINSGMPPKIYVLGCWQPHSNTTGAATANAAILAAVTARPGFGITFVDPTGWVTGTGNASAHAGNGNADYILSADDLHPTDEGHELIGWRFADAVLATYPRIGA